MERKIIIIREDQAKWIDDAEVNLSQLVQDSIDEQMGQTDGGPADAYAANAEEADQVGTELSWTG
jgi:hypothetical protein